MQPLTLTATDRHGWISPRPEKPISPAQDITTEFPAPTPSEPEDVAAAVVFLSSPASRQITAQVIHTSAGAVVGSA